MATWSLREGSKPKEPETKSWVRKSFLGLSSLTARKSKAGLFRGSGLGCGWLSHVNYCFYGQTRFLGFRVYGQILLRLLKSPISRSKPKQKTLYERHCEAGNAMSWCNYWMGSSPPSPLQSSNPNISGASNIP